MPDDFDYSQLSDEDLDYALETIVDRLGVTGVLDFGDVRSTLMEELNNDILELAAERYREEHPETWGHEVWEDPESEH